MRLMSILTASVITSKRIPLDPCTFVTIIINLIDIYIIFKATDIKIIWINETSKTL